MIPTANIKKLKTGRDLQLKSSYVSNEAARYDCDDECNTNSVEKTNTPKSQFLI